jgi:hypothetical protein
LTMASGPDAAAGGEAPLADYRIVGFVERWYRPAADVPAIPGGSCWHCHTGIAICVQIRNPVTGEVHEIGTTCAERVGLDRKALRALLAGRYADDRERRRVQRSAEYRLQREEREAAETAVYGEHGTESRFQFGCRCERCLASAPHGSWHRFGPGGCRCLDCLEFAVGEDDHTTRMLDVLVEVGSGRVVEAAQVATRYGLRWRVETVFGVDWLAVHPRHRSTLARRGYVEAEAMFLVEVCGRGSSRWDRPVHRLSDPIFDSWGEPLRCPTPSAHD